MSSTPPRDPASAPAFETEQIVANELRHRVLRWPAAVPAGAATTTPARRTVVLLHGFQDAATSWDEVAPLLSSASVDVIAPDLRGFGDTERPGVGAYYHFYDYIFDVADLIDHVSPTSPIDLVGHSMGGTVAVLYAGTFPERVRRLALLEGVGPPASPESIAPDRARHWVDGVRASRARRERSISLEEAVQRLAGSHPDVDRTIIARRAEQLTRVSSDADAASERRVWRFDPLHRTTSPIGFSVERWRAHAERIQVPTLCIGGGPKGFHPPDEATREASLPQATHDDLLDAGHMMHWTRPKELAALLRRHFDG